MPDGLDLTADGSLGLDSFDDACSAAGEDGSLVDLSAATFVDAYGLVGAAATLMSARERGRPARLRVPADTSVAAYLARMHFQRALTGHGIVADHALPEVVEHDQTGNLLELTGFRTVRDAEQLGELVFARLEGQADPQVVAALYEAVVELANNAAEHAGTTYGAFAAAQTYKRGTPDERLVLAVGDGGIGIPESVRRQHPGVEDVRALDLGLTRDVSGTGVRGRGQGLAETIELTRRLRGRVRVRSGAASAVSTDQVEITAAPPFFGTVVGVRLPCRPGR